MMAIFKRINDKLFANAGNTTADKVDECVRRIKRADTLESADIFVEYVNKFTYSIYIRNDKYSICYSSIIASVNEEIKNAE